MKNYISLAIIRVIAIKVVIVLVPILSAVCIADISLRLYHFAGEHSIFGLSPMRTTLSFYDNNIIGKAFIPNQKGLFVTETKEYYSWVEVNSQGWPDIEHSIEKSKDVYRILILGDSFVENFQVPFEKRFFRQLQEKLGNKFEVIALGRGNTGSAQQYLLLKNFGLIYQPDLVVQMFLTANDVKNNSPVLQNDPYLPYFDLDNKKDLVEIPHIKREQRRLANLKELLKNLRVVELLLAVRQKFLEYKANRKMNGYPVDYHIYDQSYNSDYQKAWQVTQKLLLETKRISEDAGAKYLLVTLANNEQLNIKVQEEISKNYPGAKAANLDFEKADKVIADFCTKEKFTCWQMLPFFKNYLQLHPESTTHYFYDGHWNEIGTNLTARFLFENLEDYFSIK